jgi:hypothetical protein
MCLLGVICVCKPRETISSTLFKCSDKNLVLSLIYGTVFKAWTQNHGKLEAVSTALPGVLINGL